LICTRSLHALQNGRGAGRREESLKALLQQSKALSLVLPAMTKLIRLQVSLSMQRAQTDYGYAFDHLSILDAHLNLAHVVIPPAAAVLCQSTSADDEVPMAPRQETCDAYRNRCVEVAIHVATGGVRSHACRTCPARQRACSASSSAGCAQRHGTHQSLPMHAAEPLLCRSIACLTCHSICVHHSERAAAKTLGS
jgi:hypothetical protein